MAATKMILLTEEKYERLLKRNSETVKNSDHKEVNETHTKPKTVGKKRKIESTPPPPPGKPKSKKKRNLNVSKSKSTYKRYG